MNVSQAYDLVKSERETKLHKVFFTGKPKID